MVRLFVACALAICSASASAASSNDEAWSTQFRSKINILPKPSGDCSVCFFEEANFAGSKFCVGKREKSCVNANPISAPGTIESIKFGRGCNLVVNVRVADVPYDEHVAVISKDVASTGYNVTSQHSVQEVYVEEAGRACVLGVPSSGTGYGLCYTNDAPAVDDRYRDSITELMLFKSDAKDFDVIAYENDDYNSPTKTPVQKDTSDGNTPAIEQRFTGYSKTLETSETDAKTGMKETLQNKVRSIKFVSADDNASQHDATPGSVAPASYSF